MKFIHYYVTTDVSKRGPHEFGIEKPELPETTSNSALTKAFVRMVIGRHALGQTPFYLNVPRDILYEVHEWNFPPSLLRINAIEGKAESDCSPCDTASIQFPDCVVFIHARRCRIAYDIA